jgi:signal peptidase I
MTQMEQVEPTEEQPQKASWDDTIRTIIFALLLATVFRSCAYEPFHIPSGSMKSTLLVGDYLFVSKPSYGYSRYSFPFGLPLFQGRIFYTPPERGDVVVFRVPPHPQIDYIKRIIGLPGDKIQVREGTVYINDVPVKDERAPNDFTDIENPRGVKTIPSFSETLPNGKTFRILKEYRENTAPIDAKYTVDNTQEYEVPPGKYFMMGDNRDNSRDSRFLDEVGYVPEENIVGKAKFIFFSHDDSGEFWEFWKWPRMIRFSRMFTKIN